MQLKAITSKDVETLRTKLKEIRKQYIEHTENLLDLDADKTETPRQTEATYAAYNQFINSPADLSSRERRRYEYRIRHLQPLIGHIQNWNEDNFLISLETFQQEKLSQKERELISEQPKLFANLHKLENQNKALLLIEMQDIASFLYNSLVYAKIFTLNPFALKNIVKNFYIVKTVYQLPQDDINRWSYVDIAKFHELFAHLLVQWGKLGLFISNEDRQKQKTEYGRLSEELRRMQYNFYDGDTVVFEVAKALIKKRESRSLSIIAELKFLQACSVALEMFPTVGSSAQRDMIGAFVQGDEEFRNYLFANQVLFGKDYDKKAVGLDAELLNAARRSMFAYSRQLASKIYSPKKYKRSHI